MLASDSAILVSSLLSHGVIVGIRSGCSAATLTVHSGNFRSDRSFIFLILLILRVEIRSFARSWVLVQELRYLIIFDLISIPLLL